MPQWECLETEETRGLFFVCFYLLNFIVTSSGLGPSVLEIGGCGGVDGDVMGVVIAKSPGTDGIGHFLGLLGLKMETYKYLKISHYCISYHSSLAQVTQI